MMISKLMHFHCHYPTKRVTNLPKKMMTNLTDSVVLVLIEIHTVPKSLLKMTTWGHGEKVSLTYIRKIYEL